VWTDLPELIETEEQLDEVMTRPSPALVGFMRTLDGPLVVLGAGGKMGPTLAVLAQRAATTAGSSLEVIAVSRFGDSRARTWLEARGVKTISCDLLDEAGVARLPDAPNVVYLVGIKFGTAQHPARTWAVNTLVPAYVARRYRGSRMAALSTGNVYPLTPVQGGGSRETDPLTPLGEYANACVARERILEYFSEQLLMPVTLLRLYYALDLRYGVLVDIATHIHRGEPVDVAMGYLNCIWQGDANEMILRALGVAAVPPRALNLARPEVFSVREVGQQLGQLLGKPLHVVGAEAPTAYLCNTGTLNRLLGTPATPLEVVLRWTAHWVESGGRTFGRPTHFEVRNGRY
jgi:dTDP-4-dehydrorhamnose reductase